MEKEEISMKIEQLEGRKLYLEKNLKEITENYEILKTINEKDQISKLLSRN